MILLFDLAHDFVFLFLSFHQTSQYYAATFVPWTIRPVYAFLSDQFPILRYRRRPYLLFCSLFACFMQLAMAWWGYSKQGFMGLAVATQVGIAFCEVICDSLSVEWGNEIVKELNRENQEKKKQRLAQNNSNNLTNLQNPPTVLTMPRAVPIKDRDLGTPLLLDEDQDIASAGDEVLIESSSRLSRSAPANCIIVKHLPDNQADGRLSPPTTYRRSATTPLSISARSNLWFDRNYQAVENRDDNETKENKNDDNNNNTNLGIHSTTSLSHSSAPAPSISTTTISSSPASSSSSFDPIQVQASTALLYLYTSLPLSSNGIMSPLFIKSRIQSECMSIRSTGSLIAAGISIGWLKFMTPRQVILWSSFSILLCIASMFWYKYERKVKTFLYFADINERKNVTRNRTNSANQNVEFNSIDNNLKKFLHDLTFLNALPELDAPSSSTITTACPSPSPPSPPPLLSTSLPSVTTDEELNVQQQEVASGVLSVNIEEINRNNSINEDDEKKNATTLSVTDPPTPLSPISIQESGVEMKELIQSASLSDEIDTEQAEEADVVMVPHSYWSFFYQKLVSLLSAILLLLRPLIFIFLINLMPTSEDAYYNYLYTDYYQFLNWEYGLFNFIGLSGSLIACLSYTKLCVGKSLRKLFVLTTLLSCAIGTLQVLLAAKRNYTWLGIDDQPYVIITSFLVSFFTMLSQLPPVVLAALHSPSGFGLEASMFSLFAASAHLGTLASNEITAGVTRWFGIKQGEWNNLWIMILVCNLLEILPLFTMPILLVDPKKKKGTNKNEKQVEQMRQENEIQQQSADLPTH